jgi:hypothetical protein
MNETQAKKRGRSTRGLFKPQADCSEFSIQVPTILVNNNDDDDDNGVLVITSSSSPRARSKRQRSTATRFSDSENNETTTTTSATYHYQTGGSLRIKKGELMISSCLKQQQRTSSASSTLGLPREKYAYRFARSKSERSKSSAAAVVPPAAVVLLPRNDEQDEDATRLSVLTGDHFATDEERLLEEEPSSGMIQLTRNGAADTNDYVVKLSKNNREIVLQKSEFYKVDIVGDHHIINEQDMDSEMLVDGKKSKKMSKKREQGDDESIVSIFV